MSLQDVLKAIDEARRKILLVAVTKNQPIEKVLQLYKEGCRDFGENRVQEALSKMEVVPADIHWHFIGKLQKNKVSKAVGRFDLIHSVDSCELAELIGKESKKKGSTTSILLEVNISGEETKSGLKPELLREYFPALLEIEGIEIKGLMTMAPFTQDEKILRDVFSKLRKLKEELQLKELSMGMSNDFKIAIEEGATILRIGRGLWYV